MTFFGPLIYIPSKTTYKCTNVTFLYKKKIDGVAPLVPYGSTTSLMKVHHYEQYGVFPRQILLSWRTSLFARSGKTTITFEPMQWCNLKILQDLESPKAVQLSLFYDCLHYLLPFRHDGPVKAAEEEDDWLNKSISSKGVCRT